MNNVHSIYCCANNIIRVYRRQWAICTLIDRKLWCSSRALVLLREEIHSESILLLINYFQTLSHHNWNIDWNHGEISCAARRDECRSSPCKTKHATYLKEQSFDKFYHRLALTEIVIRSTFLLHVSGDDDDVSVIPLNRYIRPIWCPVCTGLDRNHTQFLVLHVLDDGR